MIKIIGKSGDFGIIFTLWGTTLGNKQKLKIIKIVSILLLLLNKKPK
jgi:hypothetical protein